MLDDWQTYISLLFIRDIIVISILQLVETQEKYRFTQLISDQAGSRSLSHVPVDLKQMTSPSVKREKLLFIVIRKNT